MASDLAESLPSAAERAKADILDVATAEFSEKGFAGARVDEIAARTQTSKRMIYYYFRDKEGLFVAVLEQGYRNMRLLERSLEIESLPPVAAMQRLIAATFDYQAAHESFVRLVMAENVDRAAHLKTAGLSRRLRAGALDLVEAVYDRGVADGVFRAGLRPLDIHMTISALSFFNVSNRATFSLLFDHDMADPEESQRRRAVVVETVLRYLAKP
jgi:AcrR family transcriptional regulator